MMLVTSMIILCSIILIPRYIYESYLKFGEWLMIRDNRIRDECEKKYLVTNGDLN